MTRFFRVTLRTSDVAGARAFYEEILGKGPLDIVRLHDEAVARGARPHWLGFLDVGDVDRAAAAFVERGATPLGPKWVNPAGLEAAVMRDPGGAPVALAKPGNSPPVGPDVRFYLLNTADLARVTSTYGELFGWAFGEPLDLGAHGVLHPFAWERRGPTAGWVSDIARRPGVHPHWLLHMHVAALDPAIERVRALGGLVLGPFALPDGGRLAVCDDPQGAAFALREERG